MRPQNPVDWTAFVFLVVGAFSWAYFVTDTNILDKTLEAIPDILDDIVSVLVGLSGLWWLYRDVAARHVSVLSGQVTVEVPQTAAFRHRRDRPQTREGGACCSSASELRSRARPHDRSSATR
jgi:uncharacterized membrane protein YuzA (DUF378 family)